MTNHEAQPRTAFPPKSDLLRRFKACSHHRNRIEVNWTSYPRRRESHGGGYGVYLRLSVWLLAIPHDISKIDAARITRLDTEMFYDESWKPIYFWVKRSKVNIKSHINIADVGLCTFVSASFFYFCQFSLFQSRRYECTFTLPTSVPSLKYPVVLKLISKKVTKVSQHRRWSENPADLRSVQMHLPG